MTLKVAKKPNSKPKTRKKPKGNPRRAPDTKNKLSKPAMEAMPLSELQETVKNYKEGRMALAEQIKDTTRRLKEARAAGEPLDVQLSSHLKYLTDGMGVIARELRQIETHEYKTASQLSPEEQDSLIVSHILDGLPPKRREAVLKALGVKAGKARGLL